jgi:hypothetical protein
MEPLAKVARSLEKYADMLAAAGISEEVSGPL